MSSPNKRRKDESQAFSQLRKELEKKQEAVKISERAKNQLKKKVDELSKKHQQLKEEFQATFQGLNVEKERLATKVEKQTKMIDHLRRCELVKAKKLFKYAKYFSEIDENLPMEVEEMLVGSNRDKRLFEERSKSKKPDSINQATEERKCVENSKQRCEDALTGNFNVWASLDKHIEQNNKKKQLLSALLKETRLLADKDLEIWNNNKELQQTQTILAKFIVDLSITRAKHQIEIQKMICDRGKCYQSCCYSKADPREQENKMMTIQQGLSMTEQIARFRSDARSVRSAESMKVKLTDVQLKSKVIDGTAFESADETRKQTMRSEDLTMVTCRPEDRCETQRCSSFEKGKKNSVEEAGSTGKVGRRLLDRILRRRRRANVAGM